MDSVEVVARPSFEKFVYVERVGYFETSAPKAWHDFYNLCGSMFNATNAKEMVALHYIDKTKKNDEGYVYQAGVVLLDEGKSMDALLPAGVQCKKLHAGKFARVIHLGSYQLLGGAYKQAFSALEASKIKVKEGEFLIEKYVNTPQDTKEADLITELYFPIE